VEAWRLLMLRRDGRRKKAGQEDLRFHNSIPKRSCRKKGQGAVLAKREKREFKRAFPLEREPKGKKNQEKTESVKRKYHDLGGLKSRTF